MRHTEHEIADMRNGERATGGKPSIGSSTSTLVNDIRGLITSAREHVATTANATLTLLYWRIGHRIRTEVLGSARAGYGEKIVVTLSRQLSEEHGSSFKEKRTWLG